MYLGSVGVAALLLGMAAFVLAMFSLREENSFKLFPYLASFTSFFSVGIWAALYAAGFLLA